MPRILVTGATGLVGSHALQYLLRSGYSVRAFVRSRSLAMPIPIQAGDRLEFARGSLDDAASVRSAVTGVTHIVHCAAKVGDWGPVQAYRDVNVVGLQTLLEACRTEAPALERFVHISSLGVYAARDHYGTDESETASGTGMDGYTWSKIESEAVVLTKARKTKLPAVVLRPGFVYGAGDRTVLPRLIKKLKSGGFAFLGSGKQLLNNIYAENLALAIDRALFGDGLEGEVFNITDARLVTRLEFVSTICTELCLPIPARHVPLALAKGVAGVLEPLWRLTGSELPPVLSRASIKFLGLNLDFSIDKARTRLGYAPAIDFCEGMARTLRGETPVDG